MKLYRGQIDKMARELADCYIENKSIEVDDDNLEEFYLDIASILRNYIELDKKIHNETQDLLTARNLDYGSYKRVKREIAKKYNFGIEEDAIDWITDQIIEMIFHTNHVDEVWAEDSDIRRLSRPILNQYNDMEREIDEEVRKKIKNLSEGSVAWDVRYQQIMRDVKKTRGLD